MPISIIIEDGSNVPDANSYVSISDARLYASNRGISLPVNDDAVASMLIQGMDYLEAKNCEYQGYPTYPENLAWPRTGVVINCQDFPVNAIPKQLIAAQVQLAMAINEGISIFPNVTASDLVIEETVGPITTKYADVTKMGLTQLSPQLSAVDALLKPLTQTCSQAFGIKTIRV